MKSVCFYSLLLSIVLNIFITGCWDYHELDNDASVSLLLFDLSDTGKPEVTAELRNRGKNTVQGAGARKEPSMAATFIQKQGDSFSQAIDNISTSKDMDYSHYSGYIWSEKMAKSKFLEDYLDRIIRISDSRRARRRALIFLTSANAHDVFGATIPLSEETIGEGLIGLANESIRNQYSNKTDLNDFFYELSIPGIEPIAPRIVVQANSLTGQNEISLSGVGAFRGKRFVGWLSREETRGLLWLKGQSGSPELFTIRWGDQILTIRTYKIYGNISVLSGKSLHKPPEFQVQIHWKGTVGMYTGQKLLTSADIPSIEQVIAKYIEGVADKSIQRGQQLKSDVFGFGNALYCKEPTYYRKQFGDKWDTTGFPNIRIHFVIRPELEGFGFTTNPPLDDR